MMTTLDEPKTYIIQEDPLHQSQFTEPEITKHFLLENGDAFLHELCEHIIDNINVASEIKDLLITINSVYDNQNDIIKLLIDFINHYDGECCLCLCSHNNLMHRNIKKCEYIFNIYRRVIQNDYTVLIPLEFVYNDEEDDDEDW